MSNEAITLAISGASGAVYGLRLLQCLLDSGNKVYLLVTTAAQVVISTETELKLPSRPEEIKEFFADLYQVQPGQLQTFAKEQWMAPIASGSNCARAMVVCPCSSATLSAIANGASQDLLERAADVTLKEQKKLILVTREMPLSAIHLRNMLTLANMGVTIMPASPGFYYKPEKIQHIVDFVVARILDHLDIEQSLIPRWAAGDKQ